MFRLTVRVLLLAAFCLVTAWPVGAQKRRAPAGGRAGVVVDERLAALREAPELSARLVRRLGRGRAVAITGARRSAADGVTFYRVALTRRTGGWVQAEAVVAPAVARDDERLLRLVRASEGFDRVARARIFLDTFTRSPLRPAVLLLFGDAAADAAVRLSREARSRLKEDEMIAGGAVPHSYFLNYSGLDRYRRQGVGFVFDRAARQFHYDGAAWREILRRHPRSPEAGEARKRLEALPSVAR